MFIVSINFFVSLLSIFFSPFITVSAINIFFSPFITVSAINIFFSPFITVSAINIFFCPGLAYFDQLFINFLFMIFCYGSIQVNVLAYSLYNFEGALASKIQDFS